MSSLAEKQQEAPDYLVIAVDLARECVNSSSRKVSNQRLKDKILQEIDKEKPKLSYMIRVRVTDEGVDIFDGPRKDYLHGHVSISHLTGAAKYWRNYGERRGSQNYLR